MHKHFYAASSHMGTNYTYDSPCWSLYAFDNKRERDQWAAEDTEHREAVSLATARKISPWLNKCNPHDNPQGYYTYNHWRDVLHM